eukprot:GEMP01012399.1.p1 GENE.GEMP01012399.1~~GEMP01012399.1.p1  ORF type:complete len:575 (+),score=102.84 GEMP01012399.1:323-2047(+)
MGYAIGIGNVWRFPFLCGRYGGGAFLFAYLVCLVTCAFPLFYYEMVLGQYFQKGPVDVFKKLHHRYQGLAYISAAMSFVLLTYYQMVIAWAMIYFIRSFYSELPWKEDAGKYWFEEILNRTPRSENGNYTGSNELQPHLVFALFIVWAITFICLIRGIHSAGKIAYFMVIFPVVLIFVLLLNAVTLPGASDGIAYYLIPQMEYLFTFDVWVVACGQILFSLSPGTGAAISLSSFNPKTHKGLLRDAITIAVCNSAFSIIGGFVVFSVLGHTAHVRGVPVHEVAVSGPGLAFVLFADAFTTMAGGHGLAVLFFFMLLLLGLDSAFAFVQTLQTYVFDAILTRRPDLNVPGKGLPKRYAILSLTVLCCSMFLLGLPYATRRGAYYLEVVDHFCPTYCLLITVFFEYIVLGYHVGAEKILVMAESTRGADNPLPPAFRRFLEVQMKYIGPGMLFVLFMFTAISEGLVGSRLRANPDGYTVYDGFPSGTIAMGWLTVIIPVAIFIFFIIKVDLQRVFCAILCPRLSRLLRKTRPSPNDYVNMQGLGQSAGYPHLTPEVIGRANGRPDLHKLPGRRVDL